MKHNIRQTSPFATKQLGDKLNKVIMKHNNEGEDLTLTEWLMLIVIVSALVVYIASAFYSLILS